MRRLFNFNSWSLATKLIVVMVLLSIIPLGIITIVETTINRNSTEQILRELFVEDSETFSEVIFHILLEQVAVAKSIAINDTIVEQAIQQNAEWNGLGGSSIIQAEIDVRDAIWRDGDENTPLIAQTLSADSATNPSGSQLSKITPAFPDHIEVFVTDAFGATFASNNLLSDYYQADEEWWQNAFADGEGAIYISDPEFDDSANALVILVSLPIYDQSNTQILGIVRSTVVIDLLNQVTSDFTLGDTGEILILDRNGQAITTSNLVDGTFPEAITQQFFLSNEGSFIGPDELNEESVFGFRRVGQIAHEGELVVSSEASAAIDNLGWTVVIRQKGSEAFAASDLGNQLAVIIVLIATVAAILLALVFSRTLTRQVRIIQKLFDDIEQGDLTSRAQVLSGDELGVMAGGLNNMLDNTVQLYQETESARNDLQGSVIKLLNEVADVADGDLTIEAEVTADATGAIADSFNYMVAELRELIGRVQDATQQVSYSALNIQETTETLALRSEAQAVELATASSEISNMATTMKQMSDTASESAAVGEKALNSAQRGNTAVQATISGMDRIRDQVQETAKRIKRLGESSQEIGEIVQLINELSDRTSILALNASIQAAMAGEAGKGFAVVAEEVEQLAERASQSTREIGALISTIQSETNEAVAAMETMTGEVVRGSAVANEAGQALAEIEDISSQLSNLIGSISQATAQQANSSLSLADMMKRISAVIQENAAGTKNTAVSMNEMADLANALRGSVSTFKLPSTNGSPSNGAYAA